MKTQKLKFVFKDDKYICKRERYTVVLFKDLFMDWKVQIKPYGFSWGFTSDFHCYDINSAKNAACSWIDRLSHAFISDLEREI